MLSPVSMLASGELVGDSNELQPQSLNHAGIYALSQIEPDLTGLGVKFAVICRSITYIDGEPQNDYRPNVQHNCFEAEHFAFHDGSELPGGISPHSTAICSILFGSDPDAFNPSLGQFYYEGAAPDAKAEIYEFWHFLINNVFHRLQLDADVIVTGIGSQFEDWWTRGIESLAANHGHIVVAGIGNGSEAFDPPLYPAAGSNVIGVGVVDSVRTEDLVTNLANFSLVYPEHSSLGPTSDGRCKPDIVAPGNCLVADMNNPEAYELSGNWSSFATPVVAGAIGLLVQKAKQDPDLSLAISPDGGNCVIKAILMNSATKLPFWHKGRLESDDDHIVPLDYIQGAGMLNAVSAYEHLIAGRSEPGSVQPRGWDLNQLDRSAAQTNTYRITMPQPAGKYIASTLVWNRHYEQMYPFDAIRSKDSNLRLEVWAVDRDNPDNSYLLDYSDSRVDNVEHIFCKAVAEYTDYEIVVSYSDIDEQTNSGGIEKYGLAWNVRDSENSDSIFWHDLNADGIVNELDFAVLLENWIASLKSPRSYLIGDVNIDGTIDANDLQILLDNRNRQAEWHIKHQDGPK